MSDLFGMTVVESSMLPIRPTPGVDARRMVRHGLADVLAWLGEEVGPPPGEEAHVIIVGDRVLASASAVGRLRKEAGK